MCAICMSAAINRVWIMWSRLRPTFMLAKSAWEPDSAGVALFNTAVNRHGWEDGTVEWCPPPLLPAHPPPARAVPACHANKTPWLGRLRSGGKTRHIKTTQSQISIICAYNAVLRYKWWVISAQFLAWPCSVPIKFRYIIFQFMDPAKTCYRNNGRHIKHKKPQRFCPQSRYGLCYFIAQTSYKLPP